MARYFAYKETVGSEKDSETRYVIKPAFLTRFVAQACEYHPVEYSGPTSASTLEEAERKLREIKAFMNNGVDISVNRLPFFTLSTSINLHDGQLRTVQRYPVGLLEKYGVRDSGAPLVRQSVLFHEDPDVTGDVVSD